MINSLEWVKEIKDWKKFLTGDLAEVADIIGADSFLELWNAFAKTNIYLSEKPLDALRREYIRQNKDKDVKTLARALNCSEMFIYSCQKETKLKDSQIDMFE